MLLAQRSFRSFGPAVVRPSRRNDPCFSSAKLSRSRFNFRLKCFALVELAAYIDGSRMREFDEFINHDASARARKIKLPD